MCDFVSIGIGRLTCRLGFYIGFSKWRWEIFYWGSTFFVCVCGYYFLFMSRIALWIECDLIVGIFFYWMLHFWLLICREMIFNRLFIIFHWVRFFCCWTLQLCDIGHFNRLFIMEIDAVIGFEFEFNNLPIMRPYFLLLGFYYVDGNYYTQVYTDINWILRVNTTAISHICECHYIWREYD